MFVHQKIVPTYTPAVRFSGAPAAPPPDKTEIPAARLAESLDFSFLLEGYLKDPQKDLLGAMDELFKRPNQEAKQFQTREELITLRNLKFRNYTPEGIRIAHLLDRWCENALKSNHPLVYTAARYHMMHEKVAHLTQDKWLDYMTQLLNHDTEKPASARMPVEQPPRDLRILDNVLIQQFVRKNRSLHTSPDTPKYPYNLDHVVTYYFPMIYAGKQVYGAEPNPFTWQPKSPERLQALQEKVISDVMKSGQPKLIKKLTENMTRYFSDAQFLAFATRVTSPAP